MRSSVAPQRTKPAASNWRVHHENDALPEVTDLMQKRTGHFLLESGHHGETWLELDALFQQPCDLQPFALQLADRLRAYELRAGSFWVMSLERITIDPAQMGGVPCIRRLRVTVSVILGQLAAGRTVDGVLEDYPYVEREDVLACLEFAASAVSERELPFVRPA